MAATSKVENAFRIPRIVMARGTDALPLRSQKASRSNLGSLVAVAVVLFAKGPDLLAGTISGAVRGRLPLASSPYYVSGDLRLPAGDSLLIEPGVELRFSPSSSFVVEGRLIAHGTEQDSIWFTSGAAQGGLPGDWNGIFLSGNATAPISRAVIAYAATGITCAGGAPVLASNTLRKNVNGIDCLDGAAPQIRDSFFIANVNAAIRCIGSAPTIRANLIIGNALGGFESAIVCNAASPAILLNLIYANGNSGIDCANGAAPHIYQNTVAVNDFGITISDANPVLHNNLITGSATGISCENASPEIRFNDVFGNTQSDFFNCPPAVGVPVTVNFNNDSCDVFANICADPLYTDPASGDFRLGERSPCIDAGNPANPASVVYYGARPDVGYHEFSESTLSVELSHFILPQQHKLRQNHPNPFNPSTTIAYEITGAEETPVRLLIYNTTGQVIRELVNMRQSPGGYQIVWAADDDANKPVAAGLYFYRLEVGDEILARRMILVR